MKTEFRKKLTQLINSESMENGSNTPDFLLAEYLTDCLDVYDRIVIAREKWYGREPQPVCPQPSFSPLTFEKEPIKQDMHVPAEMQKAMDHHKLLYGDK